MKRMSATDEEMIIDCPLMHAVIAAAREEGMTDRTKMAARCIMLKNRRSETLCSPTMTNFQGHRDGRRGFQECSFS